MQRAISVAHGWQKSFQGEPILMIIGYYGKSFALGDVNKHLPPFHRVPVTNQSTLQPKSKLERPVSILGLFTEQE